MLNVFNSRRLTVVHTDKDVFPIKQALKKAGIPCKVMVRETFTNSFNRGAGMEALASEKYRYMIYVPKQDYERAMACIAK